MIKDSLKTIALSLVVLSLVGVAYAWTEPTVSPPNQDPTISKPLTESKTGQIKAGGFWVGADAAAVASNGNRGLIVNNGLVGIGTTNPKNTLDLRGQLNIQDSTNNAAVIYFPNTGALPNLFIRSDDDPSTWEPASERMFIGANGKVGIGTTNPQGTVSICQEEACLDFKAISENMGEDNYFLPQGEASCSRTGNISPHPSYGIYRGETGAYYQCTVDDAGSFYTNRFWTGGNICQCGCEVVYLSQCVRKRTMRLFER